mmetsp:Transcript_24543/g.52058  ORF Transcript_24543/g.52058 Transcript_24543/m.52058 type:complete len:494 (-) Transcript_24543:111-1592(-)|eukprot:CAMPEP_0183711462 /NCGR_PEP_ID=MMETSP0737-20130205/6962_1 /TAXON_ID=385413 /ORGANISM="Thalassiosira miniscula, Strain CCMP1093" /LENGTH=493 /DNA_ID=CAMNT_0025939975 /DNA_START=2547 /DNA_END=4028 /DNA_ORIENTATION=-
MAKNGCDEPRLNAPRGSPRGSSSNKAGNPSIKSIKVFMLTLLVAIIVVEIWTVIRLANDNDNPSKQNNDGVDSAVAVSNRRIMRSVKPLDRSNDYIMWSKKEAYMKHCELHYKNNETWGKLHAPPVDKIEAKNIVARANVPLLNIIPTLAVLDERNITEYSLEFMKSLKQPYIIKSSHVSGGVARVHNNKYHCFKFCTNGKVIDLGPEAFNASKDQLLEDLYLDYSQLGGELQYHYITPRAVFEEDIIVGGKTNTDVTFWWVANGHPVFVSEQCGRSGEGGRQGFQMSRAFLGTDFRRLPIVFNRGTCKDMLEKPQTFDTQVEIMKTIGKLFPSEVVRIDVYGGGEKVWFSEFTFTTNGCWKTFKPAVTDGLLYALMEKRISPDIVTPEYVERMLTDDSWVLLLEEQRLFSHSYPSPVDLCTALEDFGEDRKMVFHMCIQKLWLVQGSPIRCLVAEKNATELHSFGVNGPSEDVSNTKACATRYYKNKVQAIG